MYNEASEAHMLCAVQIEETRFLISSDPSFPESLDAGTVDASTALAEMWYDARAKRYRLTSTSSCENCDERLGKYTCGVAGKHGERHRQHLLDVFQVSMRRRSRLAGTECCSRHQPYLPLTWHRVRVSGGASLGSQKHVVSKSGVTLRVMTIDLPMVLRQRQRVVWCPRNARGTGGRGRSVRIVPRGEKQSSTRTPLPEDSDGNPIEFLQLKNDLPDWDEGECGPVLPACVHV